MSEVKAQVVVVGAGPAGAMAARKAAEGGCDTVLLERKSRVGVPVRCGEAVGLKGVSRTLQVRPEWILSTIRSLTMISPSGIRARLANVQEGYVIDRRRMDADLVADAVAAGAAYYSSTPVVSVREEEHGRYVCEGGNRVFRGRCVILAEGVESRLARRLGVRTRLDPCDIETCAFARLAAATVDPDTVMLYFGSDIAPGGYGWVFPRGDGRANVGVGVLGSRSRAGLALQMLHRFVETRLGGAALEELHCGGVPVGRWLSPLVKGGVMVVGDAARQVSALTGGGIAYALAAGSLAGEAAATAFKGGAFRQSALHGYRRRWKWGLGRGQRRSHALKRIVAEYDDAMLDGIARDLAAVDSSRLGYVGFALKAFRRRPLHLLRAVALFR